MAVLGILAATPAPAADRERIAAFVAVTGYDVAVEGVRAGALAGPGVAGGVAEAFGRQYAALVSEVFELASMQERALDMLARALSDELLHAGADFYASDLGQRLVEVENQSHLSPYGERRPQGERLLQDLVGSNPARVQTLVAMQMAIGSEDVSRRAMVEIQARFLLAADAAGALELSMSEAELRARLMEEAVGRSDASRIEALVSNVWTYRDMSDADMQAYAQVLETPEFRQLYEVLNAVLYHLMIERYEMLGTRLAELTPEQEL